MPNIDDSNIVPSTSNTTESLVAIEGKKQQQIQQHQVQNEQSYTHNGENCHNKYPEKGLNLEYLKPELKTKIKKEIIKHKEEQITLLKENKQVILEFLLDNAELIKVEDLKIYEPIYKCYRQKGNCQICNSLTNIICINCSNYKNNEEFWLCINHWQQHKIEKHIGQWIR